ncbi:MAG: DMT family transporter [archaeon]
MKKEALGTLLILLTAISSGIAIVVNKFFVASIDPLILTASRALIIGIIFLAISLFISKSSNKKFNKVSWKYLVLIGIIGGSVAFWMFFEGLKLTTAGRAAFIHKTLPIYAFILAFIFLKEKITKNQILALGIMLLGLILLESGNVLTEIRTGDFLVLLATCLWAIENTIAKKAMLKKESNFVVVFSRMFFGSIILFAIIFILGKSGELLTLNSKQVAYILVSGLFLLFYVLTYYWGLKYINLSKASTILLISPVISLILGYIWLSEQVLALQLAGSLLILIGAYFTSKTKSESREI